MKWGASSAPWAVGFVVGLSCALSGCSSEESVVLLARAAATGSAQLALTLGGQEINSVIVVLSRPADTHFEPRSRSIDVQPGQRVISASFRDLPVGDGYSIEVSAGACKSSASFGIEADTTTLVELSSSCGGSSAGTGSAQLPAASDAGASEPARARMDPIVAAPATQPETSAPDAGPAAAAALDCKRCTSDFCGVKQAAVSARLDSVAAILSCVVGPDWQRSERATASSCANADLLGCYCGSVAPVVCETAAPAALAGQCRDLLLTGAGCSDSACLQANLLQAETATGAALQYVQCQQDYCYDLCFNP